MANIGAHAAKQMLDWVLGGAAATQPSSRLVALTQGQTLTMGAANSPAGSASNQNAMTFGPFSSNCSILGCLVYDTISINSGNIWWYGTLLTARTLLANDSLLINSGGLIITLS
jgi:hypothetical protein